MLLLLLIYRTVGNADYQKRVRVDLDFSIELDISSNVVYICEISFSQMKYLCEKCVYKSVN